MGVDFRARNKIPICRSLLAGATEPEKQPTLPNAFSLDAAEIATVSIPREIFVALEHRRRGTKRNGIERDGAIWHGVQRRCTRFPFGFLPKQTVLY